MFGLRGWTPSAAKVTLGTGAFLLVQAGTDPPAPPDGVLASCAWRRGDTTHYALEGLVPAAGAAVDWSPAWARSRPRASWTLLRSAGDDDLVCVPTLQGAGAPTWNPAATGGLFGLRLSHTRADLTRAVVDGILHQVVDGLEATPGGRPDGRRRVVALGLDGPAARRDLSGVRVERSLPSGLDGAGGSDARRPRRRPVEREAVVPRYPLSWSPEPGLRRRARPAPGTLGERV